MEHQITKTSAARQRAEEMFAKAEQRDVEIGAIGAIQRQDAEVAKLVRLRSLRLAKEATERVEGSAARQTGKAASPANRSKTTTG